METDYTAQWQKYSEQINAELINKLQALTDKFSYYTEDRMYKAVIEHLLKEQPFFPNTLDKTKAYQLNTEAFFEREVIESLPHGFLRERKSYKPENQKEFYEYFFNDYIYTHIEKYPNQDLIPKERQLKIFAKYLGKDNRNFLLKCIVCNVEYWTALNGSYNTDKERAAAIHIKRYLGVTPQEDITEPVQEIAGYTGETTDKPSKPKDMLMLLYMLSEYEAFNFVADRANTQQIVNALYGKRFFEKSRMPVNKYFSPEVLKAYLQGQKNQAGKEKLAEILRKIADRLDN